jgi:hypothetical protein
VSRAARAWPWAIGGVLAVTVAANVALLWTANDDQSQAFEQDYYRKAMRWDSTMAQEGRNVELGWKLAARMDRVGEGDARLAVTLTDSAGSAIRHATVTAQAIPIAHAARVSTLALTEQDGVYQGGFPLVYAGLYEVRLMAVEDGRRFTAIVRGTPDGRPLHP